MTWRGFCVVAALSRYTRRWPFTCWSRIGKSRWIRFTSSMDFLLSSCSGQVHFHSVTGDASRVCLHGPDGGQAERPAADDVEARAVPRAFYLGAVEPPLVQRASIVGADVVDRIDSVARVAKREPPSPGFGHMRRAWCDVRNRGER